MVLASVPTLVRLAREVLDAVFAEAAKGGGPPPKLDETELSRKRCKTVSLSLLSLSILHSTEPAFAMDQVCRRLQFEIQSPSVRIFRVNFIGDPSLVLLPLILIGDPSRVLVPLSSLSVPTSCAIRNLCGHLPSVFSGEAIADLATLHALLPSKSGEPVLGDFVDAVSLPTFDAGVSLRISAPISISLWVWPCDWSAKFPQSEDNEPMPAEKRPPSEILPCALRVSGGK